MRADAAEADRRLEVREAARGWHRAGAIDAATRTAIDAAYPDDRARLGPVFRILVFGFTIVAVSAFLGVFSVAMGSAMEKVGASLLLLFGIVLVVVTELQLGPFRRAQGGTEAATALLAVGYLLGGLVWLVTEGFKPGERASINIGLGLAAILTSAAAYRWGYMPFAAAAAVVLFLLLARAPNGRLLWIVVPAVLAPLLLRAGDSARLPPAHRRSCHAVAAVALFFLYLAVHLGSWDVGLVEIGITVHGHLQRQPGALRSLFAIATALVPLVALAAGIAGRRRLLINLGLVGLLASIVTLRFYVHVAPLWAALLMGGGAALVLALGLRRYLDSGAGHERHGFTAEPLFTDPERRSALEVAASVASLSPAARPAETPGFEAGGGGYGGGGATGQY